MAATNEDILLAVTRLTGEVQSVKTEIKGVHRRLSEHAEDVDRRFEAADKARGELRGDFKDFKDKEFRPLVRETGILKVFMGRVKLVGASALAGVGSAVAFLLNKVSDFF